MVFLQVLVAVPVLQGKPGAYRQSATAGREDLPPGKLERMRRSLQSLNVEGKCYRNNMQLPWNMPWNVSPRVEEPSGRPRPHRIHPP